LSPSLPFQTWTEDMKVFPIMYISLVFLLLNGCHSGQEEKQPVITITVDGRTYDERVLSSLLGKTVNVVGKKMGYDLTRKNLLFCDEPPGFLCGIEIDLPGDEAIILFIDPIDPLFKSFDEHRMWRGHNILAAKVGGIQFKNDDVCLEVGQIPFPWNFHPRRK